MTLRQRRATKTTPFEQRAFDTAHTILEASGLRYQSQQVDGLAVILMAYAENEHQVRVNVPHETPDSVGPVGVSDPVVP